MVSDDQNRTETQRPVVRRVVRKKVESAQAAQPAPVRPSAAERIAARLAQGRRTMWRRVGSLRVNVAGLRPPRWPDLRGAALAGCVVAVVSVLTGAAAIALLGATSGVAGGGPWSVVAFVGIVMVGFAASWATLRLVANPWPTPVAALAQLLFVIALLVVLPRDTEGHLFLVGVVGVAAVATHMASHLVIAAAERSADEPVRDGADPPETVSSMR